jgi:hypothetical protein
MSCKCPSEPAFHAIRSAHETLNAKLLQHVPGPGAHGILTAPTDRSCAILQATGRFTNAELAERVACRPRPACAACSAWSRGGVIEGYGAVLTARHRQAHHGVHRVTLSSQGDAALDAFERAVAACDTSWNAT